MSNNLFLNLFSNPNKKDKLEKWIQIIQKHQEFKFDSNQIKKNMFMLCDLHFAAEDLTKQEWRWTLKPGTVPIISYVINSDY